MRVSARLETRLLGTGVTALTLLFLAACTPGDGVKEDTTTAPAAPMDSVQTSAGAIDSITGVPAVPADTGGVAPDTGLVQLHPASPRRGGVIFAFAEGVAASIPRCAWKGEQIPCYAHANGVLAILP